MRNPPLTDRVENQKLAEAIDRYFVLFWKWI